MIMQAVPPVPPVPPVPTFDPNLVLSSGNLTDLLVVVAGLVAATIILWPLVRAFARRLEGRGGADAALHADVEHVQQRLAEVDALHVRVAELEERLDFAERLLAQGSPAPPSIQRGPP